MSAPNDPSAREALACIERFITLMWPNLGLNLRRSMAEEKRLVDNALANLLASLAPPAPSPVVAVLSWLAECDNLILHHSTNADAWLVSQGRLKGEVRGTGATPLDALRSAMLSAAPTAAEVLPRSRKNQPPAGASEVEIERIAQIVGREIASAEPAYYDGAIRTGLRAALAAREPAGEVGRYRHVARGTVYEIVGVASLQDASGAGCQEGDDLVVYRGEDGHLWARDNAEFHDGRFALHPVREEGRADG